jgi:hypothetical protein
MKLTTEPVAKATAGKFHTGGSEAAAKVTQASSLTSRAGFPACALSTRQDARPTKQAGCLCYAIG